MRWAFGPPDSVRDLRPEAYSIHGSLVTTGRQGLNLRPMLHVLPARHGSAAENMALDFLLLQRYPEPGWPRFRHYGWQRPAVTFGYGQEIGFVRGQLAAMTGETGGALDVCRRPTGGGIVDHRDDWTYAVVIPRGHPLEEVRAAESYRAVHGALAATLRLQDVDAVLKQPAPDIPPESGAAGICFQRAEVSDVIADRSGVKIAGAAQKRNRHGLLLQGSVWRPATGGRVDWERLQEDFVNALAAALGMESQPVPWVEFNENEVEGLVEQYSSPEWIERR